MPDPSASETTPQTTRLRPENEDGWSLAALAVAIFIVWTTWGRGGGAGRGSTVQADITLVTSDRDDLACASEKAVGSYRCEFRAPGTPWPDAFAPVDSWPPISPLDQKLYVIPGLFEQPPWPSATPRRSNGISRGSSAPASWPPASSSSSTISRTSRRDG